MDEKKELMSIDSIYNRVYTIRGQQVMLDYDLAEIYGYEVKNLNQQVKRNVARFPDDFMFRLTREEMEFVKSQFVISQDNNLFEGENGGRRTLPYAFTEQVYHCGASSKDAGKKLCAINKIENVEMIHPVIDKLLKGKEKIIKVKNFGLYSKVPGNLEKPRENK